MWMVSVQYNPFTLDCGTGFLVESCCSKVRALISMLCQEMYPTSKEMEWSAGWRMGLSWSMDLPSWNNEELSGVSLGECSQYLDGPWISHFRTPAQILRDVHGLLAEDKGLDSIAANYRISYLADVNVDIHTPDKCHKGRTDMKRYCDNADVFVCDGHAYTQSFPMLRGVRSMDWFLRRRLHSSGNRLRRRMQIRNWLRNVLVKHWMNYWMWFFSSGQAISPPYLRTLANLQSIPD